MKQRRKRRRIPVFRLRAVLRAYGFSQRKLSRLAKVAYPQINRHCKGRANPSWSTVLLYADTIGCSVAEFVGRSKCRA